MAYYKNVVLEILILQLVQMEVRQVILNMLAIEDILIMWILIVVTVSIIVMLMMAQGNILIVLSGLMVANTPFVKQKKSSFYKRIFLINSEPYLQAAVAMFELFATSARTRIVAGNFTPSGRIVRVKLHIAISKRFWFVVGRSSAIITTH